MDDFKEELGDLLLQVVFQSQIAADENLFTFDDVVEIVSDKMISRHPHVFGARNAKNADDVVDIWEQQKDLEKANKGDGFKSIMDDVTLGLPAIKRAQKLQKKAAKVGFEWDKPEDVLDKFEEEISEMREALQNGKQDEIMDELGDLFFVLTNFGRMIGADCEESLRQGNNKFVRRFKGMEALAKERGLDFEALSLDEKEMLWQDQKKIERSA
jgi:MazG family protein